MSAVILMINLNSAFTGWDVLLLVAVSAMSTALAYVHHPKWKALILSLPIPFSLASLSLGQGVNATHVLGLFFLLLYVHAVRWLHLLFRVPIVLAIVLSAAAYALLGMLLAPLVPTSGAAFWTLVAIMFAVSFSVLRLTAHRPEPGHRTPLPVWVKVPIIVGVILLLIISKKMLQGFMTMFPMVSLVAAYEARHSLWTMCRAIPVFALAFLPMLAVMRLTQPVLGIGGSLVAGWCVYLLLFGPFAVRQWRSTAD